jgi:hypothetical protein
MKHFPALFVALASIVGYSQVADTSSTRVGISMEQRQRARIRFPAEPGAVYRVESNPRAEPEG